MPNKESGDYKEFRIKWPVDTGPAVYVNNAVCQSGDSGMVLLTFYQVNPPVMMQEEQIKQAEIEAKPIVKLAIRREQLRAIIQLLEKHAGQADERNSESN